MPLFENVKLLEENPANELFGLGEEADLLTSKIDSLASLGSNVVIAYIGPFGSGKSTILEKIHKNKEDEFEWVNFELWRYSDRNKIWDGFVVETVLALSHQQTITEEDIIDEIEGVTKNPLSKQPVWLLMVVITLVWAGVSAMLWTWLRVYNHTAGIFIEAALKYALPVLFLMLAFVGVNNLLPKPQRALSRIFQFEKHLRKNLEQLRKPLVVIVEDVDRTNEEGIVFLETLRNFLRSDQSRFLFPVIVIAPQDNTDFDFSVIDKSPNGPQRSLKIYDFEFYKSSYDLWVTGLNEYLLALGTDRAYLSELNDSIKSIAGAFSQQVTMRLVKRLLRTTYEFHSMNQGADPSIALIVACLKYISIDEQLTGKKITAAYSIKRKRSFDSAPTMTFARALAKLSDNNNDFTKFDLSFESMDHEIILEVVNHVSGESTGHIVLDEKYEALL